MNAATEARVSELDRASDAAVPSAELASELFAVADLLGAQPSLRNALADPTSEDARRTGMVAAVLTGRVSQAAVEIVAQAAALRWGSAGRLTAALERQGLRTLFATAHNAGRLDAVEEELFRFSRTVVADPGLRDALNDRNTPIEGRRQLVSDLLTGKVDAATLQLAQRALAPSSQSFELTIEGYLRLAAATRQRQVAIVTVARPLTEEQRERLTSVLAGKLHRQVAVQVLVDPSVLGGVSVRVGDEIIEGTVAARLNTARQQLTN